MTEAPTPPPPIAPAVAAPEPLKLRFLGSLIEQMGAQMYPNLTATIAELVSNAWDADAKNVWVQIPLGDDWREQGTLVVCDDGTGMALADARDKYLHVGRKRREIEGSTTGAGRPLHGRKGIGKLAAFGAARVLECITKKDGRTTSFRLDYDAIRSLLPGADYVVGACQNGTSLLHPVTQLPLDHGTRILLTGLRLKQKISQDRFIKSMARRFSVRAADFEVRINGTLLPRFGLPLQFQFPRDLSAEDLAERGLTVDGDWAVQTIETDLGPREVRWWIGFTVSPLEEEADAGISILAHDKLVQRPFMFGRAQGMQDQLGQEYMVGEVRADWIDYGTGIEDDLLLANRDQLQLDDERLTKFLDWGRKFSSWAVREWGNRRREANERILREDPELQRQLADFTASERRVFGRIAKDIARLPEVPASHVTSLLGDVMEGYRDVAVRELIEAIDSENDELRPRMWELVRELGLIDARKNQRIIAGRLATIRKLEEAVQSGAHEVPREQNQVSLHELIKSDPWLLDPRWQLLGDEVRMQDLPELAGMYQPEMDGPVRMDFLYVLCPQPPAQLDQVVVVEIKRARDAAGHVHRADVDEVQKFLRYVEAVRASYDETDTVQPQIHGLMIAEGYTNEAHRVRKRLERGDNLLRFKSWKSVLDDTRRLHTSWLAVSKKRAQADTEGGETPQ